MITYDWLERWDKTNPPPIKYRDGMNEFLKSLSDLGIDDMDEIKGLYDAWWNELSETNLLGAGSLMNLHSDLTKAISIYFDGKLNPKNSYRNPIGQHELRHIALAYCKPPQDMVDQHNKRAELRLIERVSNRGWLDKPYEIVERAEALLVAGIKQNIYAKIASALCVVTGRRVREILVTAKFEAKSKYSVLFVEGKLKSRGQESSPQEIPTLIEADKVLAAMSVLRKKFLVDDTNFNLIESHKEDVRRCIIRNFADLVPTIQMVEGEMRPTTHRMRSVYNCLCTFFFAPPELRDEIYTKAIMAHDDRNATLNYTIYQISDEVIAAHGGKRQGVLLEREGVEVLEMFKGNGVHNDLVDTSDSSDDSDRNGDVMLNESKVNNALVVDDEPQLNESKVNDALVVDDEPQVTDDSSGSGDNYMEKAIALLKSSKAIDICVGLMAITGCSAGELIKATFKPTDNDGTLAFSVLGNKLDIVVTLAPTSQVFQAIESLQTHPWIKEKRLRRLSAKDISERTAHLVSSSIKNNFGITKSELFDAYSKRCGNTNNHAISASTELERTPKSKVKAVRCFESDYERFQVLMDKFGKGNQPELMATLLDLAEEVLVRKKKIADAETISADDESTQVKETSNPDLFNALAELEHKLRSEFEMKLQELQVNIAAKFTDASTNHGESFASKAPQKSKVSGNIDNSRADNASLNSHKPRQAAEDKIAHASSAVMNYNDTVAPEKSEKWHISESLLFRITGCNRPAIRKFFAAYNTMIADHNAKHELADRHNTGRSEEEKALKVYVESFAIDG